MPSAATRRCCRPIRSCSGCSRWSAFSRSPPASHDLPEYAAGFKQFGNNFAVPALFLHSFPSWFVGIAFAAIGIGALVPAAIMSIAAANLYTRNIHREFINKNPTDKQEAQIAKWVSLIVKFGALIFILFVPTQYAIQLQLLGGIWIIQTLPAVMLGAYTRWFNDWALLVGWAVGTAPGTAMAVAANLAPTYPLAIGGYTFPGYTAFYTVDPQSRRRGRADAGVQRDARRTGAGGRDRRGRLSGLKPGALPNAARYRALTQIGGVDAGINCYQAYLPVGHSLGQVLLRKFAGIEQLSDNKMVKYKRLARETAGQLAVTGDQSRK